MTESKRSEQAQDTGPDERRESHAKCEGYERAIGLLRECATSDGFVAATEDRINYRRVWGRDGGIMSLGALLSGDDELIETVRLTLKTLADHQGPHGEIPSNVDTESGRISYGGTTGRVDADLWFIIAMGEYWTATGDDDFLERMRQAIERVWFLLGCWEFNTRGLIYVPQTGDWADEYVHNGYVLYDQLLYYQAHRTMCAVHNHLHGGEDHQLKERCSRLRHLIEANYWFVADDDEIPEDVYHEVLYRKGRDTPACRSGCYWLPFFSPQGYGYRFDAFANVLASLLDLAKDRQRERVDNYIENEVLSDGPALLPAFHPVIKPADGDWKHLQMSFSHSFKNKPYEYHNGGLWPMITGFYVADLAARGRLEAAEHFLNGIHEANSMSMDGEDWAFPEFVHGQEFTPGGTKRLGWTASAAVIGAHGLDGADVFRL